VHACSSACEKRNAGRKKCSLAENSSEENLDVSQSQMDGGNFNWQYSVGAVQVCSEHKNKK
jgi:hypothetical protein